ncbi:YqgE/AlgH family protein [Nocardioides massiliensis]|uniref:Transcriptional regulator n=1 Tax=Nocardioides massiliensis TaxID=1325935 RepID=A0ABT9NIS4_9ACTN|nr:YqgE/AlgH family protein [Nocardioides massiliensis]MDP9820315.1 putative transcriptional regulator [Nocardioides massiliensis]
MVSRPRPGDLLVASPALTDPSFDRTVVLVVDSDDDGALGVVLNRPTPVTVGEVLPDWGPLVSQPDVLHQGGPVSSDSALALGVLPAEVDPPVGWRTMYVDPGTGRCVGLVDLDAPPEVVAGATAAVRVFAGYAGWGGQQILDELEEGAWYVVPATVEDVFGADADGLRERVLRRQPGMLAWVLTKPVDPELN